MTPRSPRCTALRRRLRGYDPLVEIGIGRRFDVATSLVADGISVTATDVRPIDVPPGVRFVRDDAFDPRLSVYRDAEAIYALNCPPELHAPIRAVARAIDAPFCFTTLGTDPPTIPVSIETIPGDTLFWATQRGQRTDPATPAEPTTGGGRTR